MVVSASIALRGLQSIVGRDHVLGAKAAKAFAVDGVAPLAAVRPASYEEVAAAVRWCASQGLAIIPWGRGTMMGIGNLPQRYDIALDLSRLDQVIEHQPADLTATFQAGITLGAMRRHLAKAGQMAPFDPSLPGTATVGGLLATAADGPSGPALGKPRDFTIGMKVVTADGRITKAGGRVVKNVAGYDLCKLYIGSFGTLGIIVEATFKLVPTPKEEQAIAFGIESASEACALAREAHRRGLALRTALLLNAAAASLSAGLEAGGAYLLAIGLAGSPGATGRSAREVAELARAAGAFPLTGSGIAADAGPPSLRCRLTSLPSRLPGLIPAVEAIGHRPSITAAPVAGSLWVEWRQEEPEPLLARLRQAASAHGAAWRVEICPPEMKAHTDVFGDPPEALPLMRSVKREFDPKGILSPGRFVGGI